MELMKKVNALVLGLAIFLAIGCSTEKKKEDPEPSLVQRDCKIVKQFYNHVNNNDTLSSRTDEAILNSQGQIVSVTHYYTDKSGLVTVNGTTNYTYDPSGKVVKRDHYLGSGSKLYEIFIYTYNAAGLLIDLKDYHLTIDSDTLPGHHYIFEYYPDNKLKRYYRNSSMTSYIEYSYPAINKLDSRNFEMDQTTNQPYLVSLSESELDGKNVAKYPGFLDSGPTPFLNFNGNVIRTKITNYFLGSTVTTTTTYQYNSDGYPISWKRPSNYGQLIFRGEFDYNCQ